MSIESELFTFFTVTTGSISALIGTAYYPGVIGQEADLPAVVFNRITTDRVQSLSGSSDLPMARVQFNCYASTFLAAIALTDAVRSALNDFTGAMGAVTVQHATLIDESDLPAFNIQDSKRRTFGRQLEFIINYNEA